MRVLMDLAWEATRMNAAYNVLALIGVFGAVVWYARCQARYLWSPESQDESGSEAIEPAPKRVRRK